MVNFKKEIYEVYLKDGSMITAVATNRIMAVVYVVQQKLNMMDDKIAYIKQQGGTRKIMYPFKTPIDFTTSKWRPVSKHRKGVILTGAKDEFAPPLPEPVGNTEPVQTPAHLMLLRKILDDNGVTDLRETIVDRFEHENSEDITALFEILDKAGVVGVTKRIAIIGEYISAWTNKVPVEPIGGVEAEREKVHAWVADSLMQASTPLPLTYSFDPQNVHYAMTGTPGGSAVKGEDKTDIRTLMDFFQKLVDGDIKELSEANEMLVAELKKAREGADKGVTINIRPTGQTIVIFGGKVLELSDLLPAPKGEVE